MDAGIVGPCKPEKPDWERDTSNERRWESCFRRCVAVMFRFDPDVAFVVEDGVADSANHADSYTNETQTTDPCAPTTLLLIHDWEGAEHHVQRSVDDGHVYAKQEDDRFAEQEDPWSRESCLEFLADGLGTVVDFRCRFVDFAGHLRELRCAATEDNRSVSFWDREGSDDPQCTSEDSH